MTEETIEVRPYTFRDFCLGYGINYYIGAIVNDLIDLSYVTMDTEDLVDIEKRIEILKDHIKTLKENRYIWPVPVNYAEDLYSAIDQSSKAHNPNLWILKNTANYLIKLDFANVEASLKDLKNKLPEDRIFVDLEQGSDIPFHSDKKNSRDKLSSQLRSISNSGFDPEFIREVTAQTPDHEAQFFDSESVLSRHNAYQFFGLALSGEVGELCNVLKKIVRGDKNEKKLIKDAQSELADVFIYLLLLARRLDMCPSQNDDLAQHMRFNKEEYFTHMLGERAVSECRKYDERFPVGTCVKVGKLEEVYVVVGPSVYRTNLQKDVYLKLIAESGLITFRKARLAEKAGKSTLNPLSTYINDYLVHSWRDRRKNIQYRGQDFEVLDSTLAIKGELHIKLKDRFGLVTIMSYVDLVRDNKVSVNAKYSPRYRNNSGVYVKYTCEGRVSYHVMQTPVYYDLQGRSMVRLHGKSEAVQRFTVGSIANSEKDKLELLKQCVLYMPVGSKVIYDNKEFTVTSLPYVNHEGDAEIVLDGSIVDYNAVRKLT